MRESFGFGRPFENFLAKFLFSSGSQQIQQRYRCLLWLFFKNPVTGIRQNNDRWFVGHNFVIPLPMNRCFRTGRSELYNSVFAVADIVDIQPLVELLVERFRTVDVSNRYDYHF